MFHDFDKILNALSSLLAGIILVWLARLGPKIETLLKKSKKHISLENEIQRDTRCTALLNRALGELVADRVFYSKLHNGDGLAATRKSRVYEVVGPGMVNDFELYQNVPIGLVTEEMTLLEEEGPSWRLIEDFPDCKFRRLLQISGIRGLARCAVRRNRSIIGFIGAEFVTTDARPENIDVLVRYAALIEQTLELYEPP